MRKDHARCSEDIDGVFEDGLVEFREHGALKHEVDGDAEDRFEMAGGAREVQQPDRPLEIDEQVDVAAPPRLAARH